MTRTPMTLAAATIALALAGVVAAQPGPGGRVGRGPGRLMDALDLTDAQRQKVQPLLDQHREATAGLREKARSDRQAFRQLMQSAQPDAAAVGRAALAMKADRDAMKAQRDALRAKLAPILTPEQNAKLEGFAAGMRAGRGMRGGPGAGHGMRRGGPGL